MRPPELHRSEKVKRDIPARKRAEEALRQASAYNRSLLEASLDPLVTIGPDGKITDVNAATEAVTGCDRATLIGTDFSDYFTDPERARAGYQQVFREGFVRDYPLELRHRDGRITSVLYNASVYRDENGNVVGVFAAARDITERKHAEEALRQSEQRFSSMLEAVRDYAIIFLELDGRVASWNKGAERIKGYRAEEIVGQHFSRFYTPADIANGKPDHELQVATSEGQFEDEDWRVRKGGSQFWANVVITALRDVSGKVNGFVKITRDLTARKQAEDEIRRYAEDLKRSNQELEHFAYVASHDLQEPLRTVSSFSQLLARRYQGKLDADADEFITFVVEGATRMQTLINDLLAFSRIGTRGNPFAPVDCEEILQAAKENLEVAIAESGAVITHDPLPALVADQTQLTQLFQNLFSNAIKFRRPAEAPRIHVSAARQDGAWRFSVRDNGIGIDPQYFDRIFIIFQRLHGREEYSGTGIGLAICKKIVERHGGRMWVESEPGTGSTFHFTIPDERTRFRMNPVRPIDILLVEDSPADVRLTREALKEAKVLNTLHVVQDGMAALAFLRKEGQYAGSPRPDLILLDLNLPKKDGREVLAEIKQDENLKRIPVVVLTTSRAEEDVVRSYNLHANAYVTKPVDLTQFLEVIRAIEEFWLAVVTLPPGEKRK